MERELATGVLAIQRCMADATPLSWRDGIVIAVHDDVVEIALLDGRVLPLRVAGTGAVVTVGEPAAYHPVAEILAVAGVTSTARA